jgi:lysozyme
MMNVVGVLKIEEGYSSVPFIDTEGYPTIGNGQRIGPKHASLDMYQFTVNEEVAEAWLRASLNEKIEHCKAFKRVELALSACRNSEVRHSVILCMAYQLGAAGLNGFKKFLGAVIDHDWQLAHDEMLDSLWARQVPNRANRMAAMMLSNDWDSYYLKI